MIGRDGVRAAVRRVGPRIAAAAVVAAGLVGSGGGVRAAAATVAPAGPVQPLALAASVTSTDTCTAVRADLRRHGVAGKRYVSCLTVGGTPTRSAAGPAVPSDCAFDKLVVSTRFQSCVENPWVYQIIDPTTGAVLGRANGVMTFWNSLSYNSRIWNENGNLAVKAVSGDAVGATMEARFDCLIACGVTPTTTSWAPQTKLVPVKVGAVYSGAQSFGSPGTSTAFINFQIEYTIENADPAIPPAVGIGGNTSGDTTFRCDSFSYFKPSLGGCAYYQYPYSSFTVSLTDPAVAQAAKTDQIGQTTLSTHPGLFGSGGALTRDTSTTDQNANRAKACKGVKPSCDEYPFASTHQGAAFGPFVARSINATQNVNEGRRLGTFYLQQRIAEADSFYVVVVP